MKPSARDWLLLYAVHGVAWRGQHAAVVSQQRLGRGADLAGDGLGIPVAAAKRPINKIVSAQRAALL